VHIYGQSLPVGGEETGAAQHIGLGSRLIQKAEEITRTRGFHHLAVISAIGTRNYYLRQGFDLGDLYMVRNLD
jgi:elongator complex protein 3